MTKFHGMIKEVDLLRSRIAELEDGACRFNCRKEKAAFMAGWMWELTTDLEDGDSEERDHAELCYQNWIKERE